MEKRLKYSYISIGISILFIVLLCITVGTFWYQLKISAERKIIRDIAVLVPILNNINEQCHIVGFKHDRNFLDFLNVIAFEGSEVGSMIVKYPKKWKGPYVRDNPTVQAKYYEIIKTKNGYYLMPGYGVKVNNKEVGNDIVIDQNSEFEKNQRLYFYGKPLFAPLPFLTL